MQNLIIFNKCIAFAFFFIYNVPTRDRQDSLCRKEARVPSDHFRSVSRGSCPWCFIVFGCSAAISIFLFQYGLGVMPYKYHWPYLFVQYCVIVLLYRLTLMYSTNILAVNRKGKGSTILCHALFLLVSCNIYRIVGVFS